MYKTLSKADLPALIDKWLDQSIVYTTIQRGNLTEFQPVVDSTQVVLGLTTNTRYPPKSFFLPQAETMFQVQDLKFESTEAEAPPRVILGIRACDARAVQLLDGIFMSEGCQDPYWAHKRDRTTLVVLGCANPGETCFCTTVGSGPFDWRGADVMLTDLGDAYLVDVLSEKGQALLGHLRDASQKQVDHAGQVQNAAASAMNKAFETEGIKDRLYSLFGSDFWSEIQQSCLGCGVCTFLCPTCHCFDIVDEVQRCQRVRNWDTCMFRIYSQEASGHNPRPTNVERTRQRIMHKFAYLVENYGEIGCTGCGRCVRYCPVNLDIRHIIRSSQMKEVP